MTGKYETVSAKKEDIKAIWAITIWLTTAITDLFTTILRKKISKIFCHYLFSLIALQKEIMDRRAGLSSLAMQLQTTLAQLSRF